MLKQLILENWKSFRYAELPLDPLTVLIGTNASGKSNVVEALEFLQRIFIGKDVKPALLGNLTLPSIRGGVEWAAFKPEKIFTLKVLFQGKSDNKDHFYSITVQTKPKIIVLKESFIDQEYQLNSQINPVTKLSITSETLNQFEKVVDYQYADFYGDDKHIEHSFPSETILNNPNRYISLFTEDEEKIYKMIQDIENICILNPIPSKMRDYSRLSDSLESDASNIAGILAALDEKEKVEVESTLSEYIKYLPEGDIQKVWTEKVGRFGTDAMLYCQEEWKPGHITEIDARSMSDGTLRFLAILTALLTRPEGSQLVIEEIDNGLHPSRAELLVRILREIGSKRKIDILITTHNPALLDALGPEIVPFVVVAHRDSETGESKLTLLEDIENLPLLLASGTLGRLATKGAIEKSLSDNK